MGTAAEALIDAFLVGLGGGVIEHPDIDPCANDLEFVRRYGIRIDHRPFNFAEYSHMAEIFEDEHREQVIMAGAQTGKSARLIVRFLRAGIQRWGSMLGYYFPDQPLAYAFSDKRFAPLVRSSPELGAWLGKRSEREKGTDHVGSRTYGPSTYFFLSVRGKTSTEGLPMQGVFFDEVRRMSYGDIQRAEERTSAQENPLKIKVSTAFYPNSDIHAAFLEGDQRYFHTDCDCPDGCVLALTYPDCLVSLKGVTLEFRRKVEHVYTMAGLPWLGMTEEKIAEYGEAVFVCPKCGKVIVNPRAGWWEPHNPGAWAHSYQLPQLVSPSYTASRCLAKVERPSETVDVQEIYNSMVGLPYLDAERRPVSPENLLSCVVDSAKWPARQSDRWRRRFLRNTALGLDAQGGYNVIVIKAVQPNGKFRTIHLEVIHGEDPWKETARRMEEYNVRVAVIDGEPHWNEAHRFALAFPGRVWLKVYTGPGSPMIDWKDRAKAPAGQRNAGEDVRYKWMVHMNRTRALQWSLSRWKRGLNEVPPPTGLIQQLPRQRGNVILTPGLRVGRMEAVPICRDVYFDHLQCVAFRKDYGADPEGVNRRNNAYVVVADHVGKDPHFSHANLYADVACSRLGRPAKSAPTG